MKSTLSNLLLDFQIEPDSHMVLA